MSVNVPGIALLYSSTRAFCLSWLSTTVISPLSLLHSKCESLFVLNSGKIVSFGFGKRQTSSMLFSTHSIPSSMCQRAVSQLIMLPFARDLEKDVGVSQILYCQKKYDLLASCPVLELFIWQGPIPVVEVCCHASWCCTVYFKVACTTHDINFKQQFLWNLHPFKIFIH